MSGRKLLSAFAWLPILAVLSTVPCTTSAQTAANRTLKEHTQALFISGAVMHPVAISASTIRAMPQVQLRVMNGHTKISETYSGVWLTYLLAKAGVPTGKNLHGKALSLYLLAVGKDGYQAILSVPETDASFHDGSKVLVADAMDGKPLNSADGPLRLVVEGDKYPARWVRNLARIQVKSANKGTSAN